MTAKLLKVTSYASESFTTALTSSGSLKVSEADPLISFACSVVMVIVPEAMFNGFSTAGSRKDVGLAKMRISRLFAASTGLPIVMFEISPMLISKPRMKKGRKERTAFQANVNPRPKITVLSLISLDGN